jgi:Spy/CpxP family protein refolding chaperone
MHPTYWPFGHHRSVAQGCGPGRRGCGPRGWQRGRREEPADDGGEFMGHGPGDPGEGGFGGGGGPFGVRRPLRFLAQKLGLDERQVAELARVLDELKTERAQAEVDNRRTLAEFADALAGEAFDAAKATGGGDRRVASATRLRDALVKALSQIHAILNAEQRARFAYLIRTGVLAV